MSAEYSVEEVRARFEAWWESTEQDVSFAHDAARHAYQAAYAERIKAGEVAVPDSMIVLLNHIEGLMDSGILPEDAIPVDMWNAVSMHNITHPPAQAAQVVTQSMVHEAMAHVPFGLSFPARFEWIANYLNAAGAEPNKACECCGVTPAGDIPGDEPVAQGEVVAFKHPAAVRSAATFLLGKFEHAPCDSSGVSCCIRCSAVAMSRWTIEALDSGVAAKPRAVPKLDHEDWAVLQRLRNALPDVGLNGWHRGVTVLSKLLAAAPSPGESA